jgi:hypothetical protein
MNITIHSVNTETLTCTGTCNDHEFTSAPFRWGSKMLMKVDDEFMDRGTRIAVGHAAKKAIRTAGLVLPEAVLKRPRKAKAEPVPETEGEAPAEVSSEA